ncbi:MAG: hypothetical protein AAGD35_01875 [Actinomycetota bacterium]
MADLAHTSGRSQSDVAHLSGLHKSTVSRYWTDVDWLEKISWKALRALQLAVPGLSEILEQDALGPWFTTLQRDLLAAGLDLDQAQAVELLDQGMPLPHLNAALVAALRVARGNVEPAARTLATSWGRDSDRALARMFQPKGLIRNHASFFESVTKMAEALLPSSSSFYPFLGLATISHHAARAGLPLLVDLQVDGPRQSAFLQRSTTIGTILSTDNVDEALRYARMVRHQPVLARIEEWSLPTFCGDHRTSSDFHVPKSIRLDRTAEEILRELREYPDAYVIYLTDAYLPRAVGMDPTLGRRREAIGQSLKHRHEATTDPVVRRIIGNAKTNLQLEHA